VLLSGFQAKEFPWHSRTLIQFEQVTLRQFEQKRVLKACTSSNKSSLLPAYNAD
jgi:hypothetical protein